MIAMSRKAVLGCGAGLMALALATGAWAQQRAFDIPAQDATKAVPEFARQAGVQIIAPGGQLRGVTTKPLRGQLDVRAALAAMLDGTGLAIASDDGTVITVRKGATRPQDLAATAVTSDEVERLSEVVVTTGTRIRGASPAAPVRVFGRDEVERSGYAQIGDFLRTIPQNFSGGANRGAQNSSVPGPSNTTDASTINLRGIGPDATLVLVNGRRLATDGHWAAPDVSAIPLAALQRLEIVTDGASALYGADAVAGVANFVLRTDYSGAELGVHIGQSSQGGGFEQIYSGLVGRNWNGGNVMAGIEYLDQDGIEARDRDFTSKAGPLQSLLRPQRRTSYFLSGEQRLTDWARLSLTSLYADRSAEATQDLAAYSYVGVSETESTSYLVAPAVRVDLPAGWTGELSATLSRSANSSTTKDNLGSSSWFEIRNSTNTFEAGASGPLLQLPSGAVKIALGGGFRKDYQTYRTLPQSLSREGDRNVGYFYGEALVPLVAPSNERFGLNQLEISAAARFEDYKDFGETTSPRIGIRYVPFSRFTVRGTWGKSFKAPTLRQLFSPVTVQYSPAQTLGSSKAGTALIIGGGNEDLLPEKSKSWTIGFDYKGGLDISATYFSIDYANRIVAPIATLAKTFTDPYNAPFIRLAPTLSDVSSVLGGAGSFINNAPVGFDPANVAALVYARQVNATAQEISGVDLSVSKAFAIKASKLSVFADLSWLDIDQQTLPNQPSIARSGLIFLPSDFRARLGGSWQVGHFVSTATVNRVAGSVDNVVVPNAQVEPWTTVDLNLRYELPRLFGHLQGADISASMTNALDRKPPYAAGGGVGVPGVLFDSANASPVGRFTSISIRQRF